MTAMPSLRDILNDTPANAVDVDFNFQTIEGHIGAELINRDGSVAMTGALDLQGPAPSAPTHAARLQDVTAAIPVGTIWQYAGAVAPTGWALCNGAEVSSLDPDYVDLFAVIGTTFGAGAGDNFRLPDMRGRFPVGVQAGQAIWDTLGEVGGNRDAAIVNHVHTTPNHNHAMGAHIHGIDHNHGSVSTTTDGDHAHAAAPTGFMFFTRRSVDGTLSVSVAAGTELWQSQQFTAVGGAHNHDVDLPNFVGNSQAMESASPTGNAAPTTNNPTGGVAVTDRNLPPYIALNFMIKL